MHRAWSPNLAKTTRREAIRARLRPARDGHVKAFAGDASTAMIRKVRAGVSSDVAGAKDAPTSISSASKSAMLRLRLARKTERGYFGRRSSLPERSAIKKAAHPDARLFS